MTNLERAQAGGSEGPESGEEMYRQVPPPVVSSEAQCQGCDGDLFQIGSFYACQTVECSRYAVPVNEFGNTDAEQENEDERNGEAADARAASGPTYAERRAHELDMYRRGGL